MAGIGHFAVGAAAARLHDAPARHRTPLRSVVAWSALSFLPDADVVGFALGVPYADDWGHRGATHSIAFSLALGAAIGLVARLRASPGAARTGMMAAGVLVSHALLDTLTNGGLGCALFWPFDSARYVAPWTPIPVSPLLLGIVSPYGLYVATVECLLFAPLFWFAVRPPLRSLVPALLWLVALWLFMSSVGSRVARW